MANERRSGGIRRDLNDLVRDDAGKISGGKIGTYIGQYIAAKILLVHSEYVVERWDALAVLFLVLTAPEAYKKYLQWRASGSTSDGTSFTKTTDTHIEEEKKNVDTGRSKDAPV